MEKPHMNCLWSHGRNETLWQLTEGVRKQPGQMWGDRNFCKGRELVPESWVGGLISRNGRAIFHTGNCWALQTQGTSPLVSWWQKWQKRACSCFGRAVSKQICVDSTWPLRPTLLVRSSVLIWLCQQNYKRVTGGKGKNPHAGGAFSFGKVSS